MVKRSSMWLFLLLSILAADAPASDRAVAFQQEKRWFAGFAGATTQARFTVEGDAGSSVTSLDDALYLRAGRFGRPMRYGVDLMRVRFDEAETWTVTGFLDYVISGGDLLSGYIGITAGGSTLRWRDSDPFDGGGRFGARGDRVNSPVAGLRAGGLIEVTEIVQVEIGYRFLWTNFEDDFDDGTLSGSVEGRNQRAIHAGVNFRFR
ncbi:hypothetical protein J2T57_002211 [Natronocella acetinitrilica]|uniref:Outer membrane protein beta-barrel domain-containing protein n=1 Tax=Natronocella acetinitrilica TaxID=414046 RepID=A0AAE3KCK1_9GAMM|nr:hypothetical protein [Natronocella acetinitrilica]MCP1675063.1 hypothetical protein [Natronocella acetinitrilica]